MNSIDHPIAVNDVNQLFRVGLVVVASDVGDITFLATFHPDSTAAAFVWSYQLHGARKNKYSDITRPLLRHRFYDNTNHYFTATIVGFSYRPISNFNHSS